MADFDRYDNEGGGNGFVMGLITGTVLGAGLGMLLAPKAGSELRGAIGEQARTLGNKASEQYRRASDSRYVGEKGREFVNQAREAVSRGAEEARDYASGTTGSSTGPTGSTWSGTAGTGSSCGSDRGTSGSGGNFRPVVVKERSVRLQADFAGPAKAGLYALSVIIPRRDAGADRAAPAGGLRLSGVAAWRGVVELVNSNDLTHAASIAYYALLSFFPFLLLVFSLLGSITDNQEDRIAVLTFVFRYFPTKLDFVTGQLDAMNRTSVQLGVAGALALLWASLGVFGAITSAVNEAWGVERQRSFWKHRMVSFLMLVAGGGVMIVALLLVGAVEVAQASSFGIMFARFQWLAVLQTLTLDYLATLLLIVAIGLVYYFIPNAKTLPRCLGRSGAHRGSLAPGVRRVRLVSRGTRASR